MSAPTNNHTITAGLRSIPEGWTLKKLKYLAKFRSGETITADQISETGTYPVFGGNGLRGFTNNYTHDGDYVLIGRQGALCGNVNYARGRFWASEHAVVASLDPKNVVGWFGEILRVMNLNQYSQSAAQPGLAVEKIQNLTAPVPPPPEQRRIAEYLNNRTEKVDRLLALRLRQMELLREQRAALIQKVVTRGLDPQVTLKDSGLPWLGEIPEHWRVERNKVIFREIDLRSSDGSEELLTVSHITGVTPRAQKGEVNMFLAESNEGYKRVEIGDLAINTMWAWMGALGFSKYPGIVSPSYNVYQFRRAADPDYFELLFRSPNFIKEIIRYSTGVWESRLRLYPRAFFEIRSPIPPLEEQKKIVEHAEQITRRTDAILSAYSRQLELLTEYRAALIHECVTGQRAVLASGKGETP